MYHIVPSRPEELLRGMRGGNSIAILSEEDKVCGSCFGFSFASFLPEDLVGSFLCAIARLEAR